MKDILLKFLSGFLMSIVVMLLFNGYVNEFMLGYLSCLGYYIGGDLYKFLSKRN